MSGFVPILTILENVAALLRTVMLEDGVTPAFAEVRIYSQEDLVQGLQEMYLYDDRICLLVPTGAENTTDQIGAFITTTQIVEFVTLVSDRNYGGEAKAMIGEPGENPGSLKLGELVKTALTHETLALKGVCIYPTSGEPFRLSVEERKEAASRECWAQTFRTCAGAVKSQLPRSLQVI